MYAQPFENITNFSNMFKFAAFSNVYMTMGVSLTTLSEWETFLVAFRSVWVTFN